MYILFTDLDGTLLNNQSRVSDFTKKVLDQFTGKGNRVVLSSGRALDSIKEVVQENGLHYPGMYISAFNGSLLYDCEQDKMILEHRLSFEAVRYLQQKAEEAGIHIQSYKQSTIVVKEKDDALNFYCIKNKLPIIYTEDFVSVMDEEPCKMLAIDMKDHDRLVRFVRETQEWREQNHIQALFSNQNYLELFDDRSGKGNAVRFLCGYLGESIENTYAFGDAPNDISMIEAAGHGVAMRNADMEVKLAADHITEYDNDQDGLARFCLLHL